MTLISAAQKKHVLEGDGGWRGGTFPGVLGWFRWLETKTYKMHVRVFLARYRSYDVCRACAGRRLNPTALAYRVGEKSLADWHALEIGAASGYSAIWMGLGLRETGGTLLTIEYDQVRAREATQLSSLSAWVTK